MFTVLGMHYTSRIKYSFYGHLIIGPLILSDWWCPSKASHIQEICQYILT